MAKRKKNKFEKSIKSHVFAGNKYKIIWKKRKDCYGLCLHPSNKPKRMYICPYLNEKDLIKTAIDEGLHCSIWELDNQCVDLISESIGEFLWRIGFRLKK